MRLLDVFDPFLNNFFDSWCPDVLAGRIAEPAWGEYVEAASELRSSVCRSDESWTEPSTWVSKQLSTWGFPRVVSILLCTHKEFDLSTWSLWQGRHETAHRVAMVR